MRLAVWCVWCGIISGLILFSSLNITAQTGLYVDEAASRFDFGSSQAQVQLVVYNPTASVTPAEVKLEILNEKNEVRAEPAQIVQLQPGKQTFVCPVTILDQEKQSELVLLRRLRYQVIPQGDLQPVQGVVALSQLCPEYFTPGLTTPRNLPRRGKWWVEAKTFHPFSGVPAQGVEVVATLTIGAEKSPQIRTVSGQTNADGLARLVFDLPPLTDSDPVALQLTCHRGKYTHTFRRDVEVEKNAQVMLTTDKPVYQPGQILHVRAIVLEQTSRLALAGVPVEFRVENSTYSEVFRTVSPTSKFGIAAIDWAIPETQPAELLTIQAQVMDVTSEVIGSTSQQVKISRYELPQFVVTAQTDRSFYLPGQTATVSASAVYLSGEPICEGLVRVIRRRDGWNQEKQTTTQVEEVIVEVKTNLAGQVQFPIDLTRDHDDFSGGGHDWFRDVSFDVEWSDPTSGKTESSRLYLRLSKTPVHLYVLSARKSLNPHVPGMVYVATCAADGTPCAAEFELTSDWLVTFGPNRTNEKRQKASLGKFKTSRYGLARVELPTDELARPDVRFSACLAELDRDRFELGFTPESFGRGPFDLKTQKTIYRPGEPLGVTLWSTLPKCWGQVSVIRGNEIVASKVVPLKPGKTSVVFPYQPNLKGKLLVAVTSPHFSSEWILPGQWVVYVPDEVPRLTIDTSSKMIEPGAEAEIVCHLQTTDGKPVTGVLGVSVVDCAIPMHIQNDGEETGPICYDGGLDQARGRWMIGRLSLSDLSRLDPAQPISDELQLVAEVLAWQWYSVPEFFREDTDLWGARCIAHFFQPDIQKQLEPLLDLVKAHVTQAITRPETVAQVESIVAAGGQSFAALRDPWGMPYQVTVTRRQARDVLEIYSSGPDRTPKTIDDFLAGECGWVYSTALKKAIDQASASYFQHTGIYIRDYDTLKTEMARQGIDLDHRRDEWGRGLFFDFPILRSCYAILVRSTGERGQASPSDEFYDGSALDRGGFLLTASVLDSFRKVREQFTATVFHSGEAILKPENREAALQAALKQNGLDLEQLRDPWGSPCFVLFKKNSLSELPESKTSEWWTISLCSPGPDKRHAGSGFTLATSSVLLEVAPPSHQAQPGSSRPGSGAMVGLVSDEFGNPLSNVRLELKNETTGRLTYHWTNQDGTYLINNLPPGQYEIISDSENLLPRSIQPVVVDVERVTLINLVLRIGEVTELEIGRMQSNTTNMNVWYAPNYFHTTPMPANRGLRVPVRSPKRPTAPHLRQDFTETALWAPRLATDHQGRVSVKLKFPPAATTWRLSVVALTADGQILQKDKFVPVGTTFMPCGCEK
ncbi:MAG: carboxypeptidase regulatory-like domain-containing protein [Acidobacteria bacterium]|nr:carboxypeptidase regulatory-like domain-containing protein [Acidobacteriota bacterium]